MAVDLQAGSPLADSLQQVLQPKLVEMGWSSDGLDDSALAEYIVLMIASGKSQDQIGTELANDLLGLGSEDTSTQEFARWLFEQVQILSGQGASTSDAMVADGSNQQQQQTASGPDNGANGEPEGSLDNADAVMDDAASSNHGASIPTGPKSMRDRPAPGKRMLGQVNKAMARTPDAILHKIKGAATAGRINTHAREPPKGPAPKGPRGPQMNRAFAMQSMTPPQQGAQMNQMMPGIAFGALSAQQQMALFAMYEEQARMMAQILQAPGGQATHNGLPLAGFPQQTQQPGKSLFDRVDAPTRKPNGSFSKRPYQNGSQHAKNHITQITTEDGIEPSSLMDVEPSPQQASDPSTTMCYFNLTCTRADCHFVHQSPAAPPGTPVDMTDTCSFGAACKNRKCVGKHPSPASAGPAKAQEDCKFFPNCTNPACPFRHPTTAPCRNGADCTTPNCKFAHSKVPCKFDPCLNPACPFKHHEGQKRGAFQDKIWVGASQGEKDHVSDRKFVDDTAGDEDLVSFSQSAQDDAAAVIS